MRANRERGALARGRWHVYELAACAWVSRIILAGQLR
jgi:hypothetical protein